MVSAVILAGGKGVRMGQEKGLMPFCGKPLIEHVIEILEGMAEDVMISVAQGNLRKYAAALGGRYHLVEDQVPGIGPLEGLATAFKEARSEYVIVSPCDTPFLNKGTCALTSSRAEGHEAAIPVVRGYPEPLHGVYKRDSGRRAFEETIHLGKRKSTDALTMLDWIAVDESSLKETDPNLIGFWNLNTPDDMHEAEAKMRAKSRSSD